MFLSGNIELVIDISQSSLSFENLGLELTASSVLILSSSLKIRLLSKLAIEVSLEGLSLNHQSGMVVLGSSQFSSCGVDSFMGSSKLEVLRISEFGQLISSLLSLVEIVVDALDSGIIVLALSFLVSNSVSKPVDLLLVLGLLFSELCQLVLKIISLLS